MCYLYCPTLPPPSPELSEDMNKWFGTRWTGDFLFIESKIGFEMKINSEWNGDTKTQSLVMNMDKDSHPYKTHVTLFAIKIEVLTSNWPFSSSHGMLPLLESNEN